MIFITTGSRSFQFNRLLEAVDKAISNGYISESVFAQIGTSDYKIKNYEYVSFLNHEEFNLKLKQCDIVLTHGGTGVIVNAAKMGKKVIAVPRLSKYGEAVDDHQIQLIDAFDRLGIITPCHDCTDSGIAEAVRLSKSKEVIEYKSNTNAILESIEAFIMNI